MVHYSSNSITTSSFAGARQPFTTQVIYPQPLHQLAKTPTLVKPKLQFIFHPKSLTKGKHSLQEQEQGNDNPFLMKAQNQHSQ